MRSKVHPKYKTKYRVGNWSAYEQALVLTRDQDTRVIHRCRTPPVRPLNEATTPLRRRLAIHSGGPIDIPVRCADLNGGADLAAAICALNRNFDLKRRCQLRQRMQHPLRRTLHQLLIVPAFEASASHRDVLQPSKSDKSATGRVGRAPSHAATSNKFRWRQRRCRITSFFTPEIADL